MPTTLIHDVTFPASQAQGAAGSTIEALVDYPGFWRTDATSFAVKAIENYTLGVLGTPKVGTAPSGQAWAQASQAVVVKYRPVAGSRLYVVLNHTGDGLGGAGTNGIRVGPDDGSVISGSVYNVAGYAIYQATSYGGVVAGTTYILKAVTQFVSATSLKLYFEIAAASAPATILGKGAALVTVPAAVATGGGCGVTADLASTIVQDVEYYSYGGTITVDGANSTATLLPGAGSDLTAPGLAITALGTTTATLAIAPSTSGTGPITYQGLSGTVSQAAGNMAASGAASSPVASGVAPPSLVLTGLTPGTWHYRGVRATDSFPSTPGEKYSRSLAFRTYTNPPIAILFTGDSITGNPWSYSDRNNDVPETIVGGIKSLTLARVVVDYLQARLDRAIVFANSAVAGAQTADWMPGGTYYTNAVSAMNAAITAAGYSGPVYVSNMLGTNDALFGVTGAVYQSNTTSRLTALRNLGWIPIEHNPAFLVDGGLNGLASAGGQGSVISTYPTALTAAVAAAAGSLRGDQSEGMRGQFALSRVAYQFDGCHPFLRGLMNLGKGQADAVAALVDPAAPGGGSYPTAADIATAVWAAAPPGTPLPVIVAAFAAVDDIGIASTVVDTTPAAAAFDGATALEAVDGFYVGCILAPTGGVLKGLARKVTSYTGATRTFGFAAPWPVAPANADSFLLFGRIN